MISKTGHRILMHLTCYTMFCFRQINNLIQKQNIELTLIIHKSQHFLNLCIFLHQSMISDFFIYEQ
mgnify:FL=1